jgi:hypothetical protein
LPRGGFGLPIRNPDTHPEGNVDELSKRDPRGNLQFDYF